MTKAPQPTHYMSDKILSRERFLVEINQSIAEQRCTTPLDLHDAALRADRDTWKAQAEAQPDAVQGLVERLAREVDECYRLMGKIPADQPNLGVRGLLTLQKALSAQSDHFAEQEREVGQVPAPPADTVIHKTACCFMCHCSQTLPESLQQCGCSCHWGERKTAPPADTPATHVETATGKPAVACIKCGDTGWLTGPGHDGEACECNSPVIPDSSRDERQRQVHDWCAAAFGAGHAASIPQRGIRHAEEAIEAAQAAGCDIAMVHKLVDHVYSNPPGKLSQEIGGSGTTLLALAHAAGLSADGEEARELMRVLAKPLSHFAARNQVKNDAGFNVDAPAVADTREPRRAQFVFDERSQIPVSQAVALGLPPELAQLDTREREWRVLWNNGVGELASGVVQFSDDGGNTWVDADTPSVTDKGNTKEK